MEKEQGVSGLSPFALLKINPFVLDIHVGLVFFVESLLRCTHKGPVNIDVRNILIRGRRSCILIDCAPTIISWAVQPEEYALDDPQCYAPTRINLIVCAVDAMHVDN